MVQNSRKELSRWTLTQLMQSLYWRSVVMPLMADKHFDEQFAIRCNFNYLDLNSILYIQ